MYRHIEFNFSHKTSAINQGAEVKGLIITAHGSRKPDSNKGIIEITQKFSDIAQDHFFPVQYAFLEFARPNLEQAIEDMIKKGSRQILIFPFFLGAGSHVTKDIPDILSKMETKYPDIQFTAMKHLGTADKINELIFAEAVKYI